MQCLKNSICKKLTDKKRKKRKQLNKTSPASLKGEWTPSVDKSV